MSKSQICQDPCRPAAPSHRNMVGMRGNTTQFCEYFVLLLSSMSPKPTSTYLSLNSGDTCSGWERKIDFQALWIWVKREVCRATFSKGFLDLGQVNTVN